MVPNEYKVKLPPVNQIGMVVKDVDKTAEFYTSCGMGPFRTYELELKGCTYHGMKGDCRLKVGISDGSPVAIELIQVLSGETPHLDFFKAKGDGVQHLGFRVADLEASLAEFAKEGIIPVFRASVPGRADFAYMGTDKVGGLMFELVAVKQ